MEELKFKDIYHYCADCKNGKDEEMEAETICKCYGELVVPFGHVRKLVKSFGDSINFIAIEKDRLAWSLKTFKHQSEFGSLRHAELEIKEIEEDPTIASEYADAIMCILDCAGRHGVTVEEVLEAYKKKININKNRSWQLVAGGHYKHIDDE